MDSSRTSGIWLVVAIALAAVLSVLAALQYNWIGQLRAAEEDRMGMHLDRSVRNFQRAFFRDLVASTLTFRYLDGDQIDAEKVIRRFEIWKTTTLHPELIQDLYIVEPGEARQLRVNRLDPDGGQFELEPAPGWLTELWAGHPEWSRPDPGGRGPTPTLYHASGVPVAVHRITNGRRARGGPERPPADTLGFVVLRFDRKYLREVHLPELTRIHFGQTPNTGYLVAVRTGPKADGFLFCQPEDCSEEMFANPDYDISLLRPFRPESNGDESDPNLRLEGGAGENADKDGWNILVKHSLGSVAQAAQNLRRKNLFLSAAILLLLAVTIGLVILWSRKVQRLAQMQMEFVAGVSHELRTPLTIIRSAADNLCEGVVTTEDKAVEYGLLLRNSAQRLSAMLEQTLQFAKVSSGTHRYNLQSVSPEEIVRASLSETQPMLNSGGFTVIQNVGPNLPQVYADRTALTHCLTNLVTNAIKYSGDSRWITIHATVEEFERGMELRIAVQDKGPGIHSDDLKLVFEPFYRGSHAKDTQAQGAGLGLSLTKKAIEAMGGYISVTSVLNQGSTFTLHFPLLQQREKEAELWKTVSS